LTFLTIRLTPLALLVVLAVGAAWGQGTEAESRAAMARVVLEQLAAFRRGDWAGAYGFASAGIQARFDPEAFRGMVTAGYAPIARSVQGTVRGSGLPLPGRGWVELRVEGANGETIDALYDLVDEQGQWRINGVRTRPAAPGVTAGRLRPGPPPG
jgi:hypothetical protein